MNKLCFVALAATAFAMPAVAQAEGGYIQVQSGLDSISVAGETDEGVAYGVAVGYDVAIDSNWFAGIELSADDSSTKECASDVLAVGDRACVKTGRDLSAIARFGINMSEASQLYVLAGYTNARLKATYDDGVTTVSAGDNGDGFRLGAGYKHNFGSNLFGKIEYRYSNYEADFSRHNVLAAIGFNF